MRDSESVIDRVRERVRDSESVIDRGRKRERDRGTYLRKRRQRARDKAEKGWALENTKYGGGKGNKF